MLFRLKSVKFCLSHQSHLSKVAELLSHTKNLESLSLEHLEGPQTNNLVVK